MRMPENPTDEDLEAVIEKMIALSTGATITEGELQPDEDPYIVQRYIMRKCSDKGATWAMIDFMHDYMKTNYLAELFVNVGNRYSGHGLTRKEKGLVEDRFRRACKERGLTANTDLHMACQESLRE
ncbi:hypothetical protein JW756_05155 [Candidatus Woesearchaeota archaeon]|nr:hypothetical protein [Candidatus Woesearchaeota archaeon]